MTIRPGDFWVADILFTDQRASKKRPVLVLWLDAADVVVAAVNAAAQCYQLYVKRVRSPLRQSGSLGQVSSTR
jgi:hypothetical protein